MKQIIMYEIREFFHPNSCYSRLFFARLVTKLRAQKIAKFLTKRGRDVIIAPVKVTVMKRAIESAT